MTVILCLLLTLTAVEDGNYSHDGPGEEMPPNPATAQYSVVELDRWSIPAGSQALGLDYMDYWYTSHTVGYVSNSDDMIYWMNGTTGSLTGISWEKDPNNPSAFGFARVLVPGGDDEIHVNDFTTIDLYYKAFNTYWDEYASLTGIDGRGMAYHQSEDKMLELSTTQDPGNYSWAVAKYTPGSSSGFFYTIDCNIGSDWVASGLALYSMFGGEMGMAVTMYQSSWIRFFEYPPTMPDMVYYGYCVLPYSAEMASSYGLAYAYDLDCFYHSWRDAASNHYISRLEVSQVALDRSTWGAIKSSF
ncbi:MAG: hypothetical protein R6U39_02855 [Candidatus Aegiribacteria sp.]